MCERVKEDKTHREPKFWGHVLTTSVHDEADEKEVHRDWFSPVLDIEPYRRSDSHKKSAYEGCHGGFVQKPRSEQQRDIRDEYRTPEELTRAVDDVEFFTTEKFGHPVWSQYQVREIDDYERLPHLLYETSFFSLLRGLEGVENSHENEGGEEGILKVLGRTEGDEH